MALTPTRRFPGDPFTLEPIGDYPPMQLTEPQFLAAPRVGNEGVLRRVGVYVGRVNDWEVLVRPLRGTAPPAPPASPLGEWVD